MQICSVFLLVAICVSCRLVTIYLQSRLSTVVMIFDYYCSQFVQAVDFSQFSGHNSWLVVNSTVEYVKSRDGFRLVLHMHLEASKLRNYKVSCFKPKQEDHFDNDQDKFKKTVKNATHENPLLIIIKISVQESQKHPLLVIAARCTSTSYAYVYVAVHVWKLNH